jgi:phosphoribosylaminoimidazole-succinocarboxamide synthase
MDTKQVIALARKHSTNSSSARVCLADAIEHFDNGRLSDAKDRALHSLAFSVGVFHKDYKRAAKAVLPSQTRNAAFPESYHIGAGELTQEDAAIYARALARGSHTYMTMLHGDARDVAIVREYVNWVKGAPFARQQLATIGLDE